MATLVAVRKEGEVCMASDCWNMREPWLKPPYSTNSSCILRLGEALIGLNSSVAYQQVFEIAISNLGQRTAPFFSSRQEVFEFFSKMHETMRNHFFMNVSFQPGQEFEWSPMNALIVTRDAIYRVDSSRGVSEFSSYWSIGTGEAFALGSLNVLYDASDKASEIASKALTVVREFEGVTTSEIVIQNIKKPMLAMASPSSGKKVKKSEAKGKTIKLSDHPRDRS